MRKILFIVLLFVCTWISAQRVDKPGEPYDYFCEIMLTNDDKALIFLPDWDDNAPQILCDKENEPIVFKNEKDMLVYMSKRGWVYLEKVIHDLHGPLLSVSKKAYFMKKVVTDDKQCTEKINPQTVDTNKKKKSKKEN